MVWFKPQPDLTTVPEGRGGGVSLPRVGHLVEVADGVGYNVQALCGGVDTAGAREGAGGLVSEGECEGQSPPLGARESAGARVGQAGKGGIVDAGFNVGKLHD